MRTHTNDHDNDTSDQLITSIELAERWSLSPQTIRRWRAKGLLPSVTLPGGSIRFPLRACEERLRWGRVR